MRHAWRTREFWDQQQHGGSHTHSRILEIGCLLVYSFCSWLVVSVQKSTSGCWSQCAFLSSPRSLLDADLFHQKSMITMPCNITKSSWTSGKYISVYWMSWVFLDSLRFPSACSSCANLITRLAATTFLVSFSFWRITRSIGLPVPEASQRRYLLQAVRKIDSASICSTPFSSNCVISAISCSSVLWYCTSSPQSMWKSGHCRFECELSESSSHASDPYWYDILDIVGYTVQRVWRTAHGHTVKNSICT